MHASNRSFPSLSPSQACSTPSFHAQMTDHDAWSVVKTKPSKQQPAAVASYGSNTTASQHTGGMVIILYDEKDKTSANDKSVQIPIGSDQSVEGGMRLTLERFRQNMGARAPACSKKNVYWITVWHELTPSESESLVGVFRLASEQELDTIYK